MLGYADAKVPESAPGRPRWCDVPLDEAVHRLVMHIREFRPEAVVTSDAHGGLTGHPDHAHTHRVTMLAVEAAGQDGHPDAGPSWAPSAVYLATHPQSSLKAIAEAAILAHRSEVDRGALPGLIARVSPMVRQELLATEWFIRRPLPS